MSTFKVAGVSTLKGQVKVRFANDLTRVKNLTKSGHTNIELLELPEALEKPAVVTFLKSTDLYSNPTYKAAILPRCGSALRRGRCLWSGWCWRHRAWRAGARGAVPAICGSSAAHAL